MSNATANPNFLTWTEIKDWSIVYGIEAVVDVIANGLTIFVILANRSLHKRFYFLLLSLAVADFLVGAVAAPMFIYVLWGFYSPEGRASKVNPDTNTAQTMVEIFTSYASIFALVAIAMERLIAVMFPAFHRNESRSSYTTAIAITWILALMTSLLFLTRFMTKVPFHFHFIMVLLVLSLLIVMVCYIIIAVKLLRSRTESLTNKQNQERRIALTLLVASVIFVILWMPFQVTNYIFHFDINVAVSHHVIYSTKFLHYFNSIINPVIYALMMKDFRRALKNVFTCRCNEEVTTPTNGQVKPISGPRSNQGYTNDDVTLTHVSEAQY